MDKSDFKLSFFAHEVMNVMLRAMERNLRNPGCSML